MARLDSNLHDLRKYGFSFVTALLTANALIGQVNGTTIPGPVRLVVFIVTLGLIVTLRLLDRDYVLFEKAASLRGVILERRLNLSITNTISVFYDREAWWGYVLAVYLSFVGLTTALGYYALSQATPKDPIDAGIMLGAGIVAAVLILITQVLDLSKGGTWSKDKYTLVDWDVDKKTISAGTPIRITITNLSRKKVLKLTQNSPSLWSIRSKTGEEIGTSSLQKEIALGYLDSHDWLWQSKGVSPGLYDLTVSLPERNATLVISSSPLKPKKIAAIQIMPKSDPEPDIS